MHERIGKADLAVLCSEMEVGLHIQTWVCAHTKTFIRKECLPREKEITGMVVLLTTVLMSAISYLFIRFQEGLHRLFLILSPCLSK